MEVLKITDYLIIFLFIWQLILSFVLVYQTGKWSKLLKDGKKLNLANILENIISKQDLFTKKIIKAENELENIKLHTNTYFQKFSLERYNPFESTGGDQSFIVTLLNGQNDGFVISSLHSRAGTRIYAKQISGGRPAVHEFSKEEKEVVEKTLKNKQPAKVNS